MNEPSFLELHVPSETNATVKQLTAASPSENLKSAGSNPPAPASVPPSSSSWIPVFAGLLVVGITLALLMTYRLRSVKVRAPVLESQF